MNKQEVIDMMTESFKSDNFQMAIQFGMEEDEINEKFNNSKDSIRYMLSNIYDLLVTNSIIKND